jgi:PAS domain S-box-containing protein
MSEMEKDKLEQLLTAFEEFRLRSEKLESSYASMEKRFEELNLELDEKNSHLKTSLEEQERVHTILDSILDTMHNGVISVDVAGVVTQFNSAAETITGYDHSKIEGQKYEDLFGEKGFSKNSVLDVLNSGRGYERDEKVIWGVDGDPIPVIYQSSLLKDKNDNLLGAVEIFGDISQIKALEEENQENKILAALGEMAATLAHEIKNPLGAMGTWARLLDRTFETGDKRKKTLGKIIDALSRLNKIVSSMLIFGRQSKGSDLRKVDIKELLSEFVDSMEIEVIFSSGKEIEVVKQWDETPLEVAVAPEKLRQVLLNLAINGIQAMGEDGTLTVSCGVHEKERSKFAQITVKDTGPGIDAEALEKIFTPFHTTKENGTGLGLAIVKKLIDFHGGVIDVESEVGVGTVFSVYLPL